VKPHFAAELQKMRDDKFEWGDRKAQLNLARHGVTFKASPRGIQRRFRR
jgi:hypothetical protein